MSPVTDPCLTLFDQGDPLERRETQRHEYHLKSSCMPVENPCTGTPWPVNIKDISKNGIRLGLYRRFEPGTLLTVEMIGVNGDSRLLLARVVRVDSHAKRRWMLGCSLVTILEEAELRELIEYPIMAWIRINLPQKAS